MKTAAVVYLRTSSQTNVDGDSRPRQEAACTAYAAAQGLTIVRTFADMAVSGADPVEGRPGFAAMLEYLLGNCARTVLVENASRFARDVMVQHMGHNLLKRHGITLVPVDAPTYFSEDTPTANLIRTILGAVSQFEKEALVAKLRKARERSGRLGGNPRWQPVADTVVRAARAARDQGLTLRGIALELAKQDMCASSGRPYSPESVQAMVDGPEKRRARLAARRAAAAGRRAAKRA